MLEEIGSCLKYLKRGWNRKEGRGNKDFKKGEGASCVKEYLKKVDWNPFTNYDQRLLGTENYERTSDRNRFVGDKHSH